MRAGKAILVGALLMLSGAAVWFWLAEVSPGQGMISIFESAAMGALGAVLGLAGFISAAVGLVQRWLGKRRADRQVAAVGGP